MDENKNTSVQSNQNDLSNWGGFSVVKPNDENVEQTVQNNGVKNEQNIQSSGSYVSNNNSEINSNIPNNQTTTENTLVTSDSKVENVQATSSNDSNITTNAMSSTSGENISEAGVEQPNFETVGPKYEEVEVKKTVKEVRTDSYFDGKLLDLFGWTILKNIITLFTVGLAGPWGECLMLKFEIGHTVLNGKRLKFVGTGGSLFVEKFKWIFFTIITLGIYSFWIPVKKTKWILSNVHFEDEEFVREESYFDGKLIQLIGINILCRFLNTISFFILFPFTECIKLRWIAKHSVINRKKIVFDGKGFGLFGRYILWLFLTLITFGIYGFWLKIKMIKWKVKNSRIKLAGEEYKKDHSIFIMIMVFCILFVFSLVFLISNPFDWSFDLENPASLFTGNKVEGVVGQDYWNCDPNGYCCDYSGEYCEWIYN